MSEATDLERDAWRDDLKRRNQSVKECRAAWQRHIDDEWELYYRARLAAKTCTRDAVKKVVETMEGARNDG